MFIAHTDTAFWHHFHPWITKNMDLETVSHFDIQNQRKSEPRAPEGRIFMILGGFWRCLIFRCFLDRQKVGQKSGKSDISDPKVVRPVILARPGGMRGATGEVRRGQNLSGFGRFWIGSLRIGEKVQHTATFLRKGRRNTYPSCKASPHRASHKV